jgi:hypothetical protein
MIQDWIRVGAKMREPPKKPPAKDTKKYRKLLHLSGSGPPSRERDPKTLPREKGRGGTRSAQTTKPSTPATVTRKNLKKNPTAHKDKPTIKTEKPY